MSKQVIETHFCPTHPSYKIVLDFNEAVPDDPGAGTPAMVYGPKDASGTFFCALETGEIDPCSPHQLPSAVSAWLERMAEHVDEYLDLAFASAAVTQD